MRVIVGDVPLVEFMYLVFTRMAGESYRWRHGLLLCVCLWRLSSSNELPCVLIQIFCVYGMRIKIRILVSAGAGMELRSAVHARYSRRFH